MPKKQFRRIIDTRKNTAALLNGLVSIGGGGGTGGGTGGGVTAHAQLTGLENNDHPQYLLRTDASSTYVTNAVLTAALVNYYDKAASDARYVAKTVQVIAGNGLIGGGELSGNVTLNLGSSLDIAAGVVGVVNADTHGHGVVSSDDVKTDAAGKKTLLNSLGGKISLFALDVNGGDLFVAGTSPTAPLIDTHRAYAGGAGSVGIGRIPDAQFMLDVGGPMRAELFIGPHAIQLSEVKFLAHYDGHITSYTGEYNSINGEIPSSVGGTYFIPGRFNKGLARSFSTENYCFNPSFENGTPEATLSAGWTTYQGGTGATWTFSNEVSHTGKLSLRIKASTIGSSLVSSSPQISIENGETALLSVWVYRTDATKSGYCGIVSSTNTLLASVNFTGPANKWVEHSMSWDNTTGAAVNVICRMNNQAADGKTIVFIDSVLLGKTATTNWNVDNIAGPYFDGHCVGATWTGTVNNSMSSISTSPITYSAGKLFDASAGTIMFWVRPYSGRGARWAQIRSTSNSSMYIQIGTSSGGTIFGRASDSVTGVTSVNGSKPNMGQWNHVALVYSDLLVSLYLNGVFQNSYVPTIPYIGGPSDQLQLLFSGAAVIDDFVITSNMLSANEIRAVYESNAPVFAESSAFSFRATPQGLVWADEEGLWVRDTLSKAVFGLYGGDTSKSWGGRTLDTGDLLIGDYASGNYVLWDDSVPLLDIGGKVTATSGKIGAWTINGQYLFSGNLFLYGSTTGGSAIWSGQPGQAGAPLQILENGTLIAEKGKIGGWTISDTSLSSAGGESVLYSDGNIKTKWILGGDTAGKLSLRPWPYVAASFFLDLTSTESVFKLPSVSVGYQSSAEHFLIIGRDSSSDHASRLALNTSAGGANQSYLYRASGLHGTLRLYNSGNGGASIQAAGGNIAFINHATYSEGNAQILINNLIELRAPLLIPVQLSPGVPSTRDQCFIFLEKIGSTYYLRCNYRNASNAISNINLATWT
jgi:hypothetical protein